MAVAQSAAGLAHVPTIEGSVRDSSGKSITAATVYIRESQQLQAVDATTDSEGKFTLSVPAAGTYVVGVRKAGFDAVSEVSVSVAPHAARHLEFVLTASSHGPSESSVSPQAMQLDDKSNFVVAGITDWTAAGGHGSDVKLRTSETLARDTSKLEPRERSELASNRTSEETLKAAVRREPKSSEAHHELGVFYLRAHREREAIPFLRAAHQLSPDNYVNAYDLAVAYERVGELTEARKLVQKIITKYDRGELHRLLGDIHEQMNDPLAAEREYERATKMDASEQNYFAWGAELLVHRAIQPAVEVFTEATKSYPNSERMLAGLGAALYASGLYEEAATKLCAASDLNPSDATPYLFLGKMQESSARPLPCAEENLARFVQGDPNNPLANYYYAVSLWKRQQTSGTDKDSQRIDSLLRKAVAVDPNFAQAYLQIGIMLHERKDLTNAIAAYKKAIERDTELAEAHFRLGQAYKRRGDISKANEQFQAYQRIEKNEAAAIEKKRREVRQFIIVMKSNSDVSSTSRHPQ